MKHIVYEERQRDTTTCPPHCIALKLLNTLTTYNEANVINMSYTRTTRVHRTSDLLCVTLEHIHFHGWVTEIPQAKCCVFTCCNNKFLRRVCTDIGEFLVMTWCNTSPTLTVHTSTPISTDTL